MIFFYFKNFGNSANGNTNMNMIIPGRRFQHQSINQLGLLFIIIIVTLFPEKSSSIWSASLKCMNCFLFFNVWWRILWWLFLYQNIFQGLAFPTKLRKNWRIFLSIYPANSPLYPLYRRILLKLSWKYSTSLLVSSQPTR